MGLFLTTTGASVVVAELGITIVHPATNYEISAQFEPEEIRDADSLTTSITNGTLEWRKIGSGGAETPADYDPDYLDVEREHTGSGAEGDRTAIIDDLVNIEEDDASKVSNARILNFEGAGVSVVDEGSNKATVTVPGGGGNDNVKSGEVLVGSLTGNPKGATVTFNTAFADANYSIQLTCRVTDGANASWIPTAENRADDSFDINMNSSNVNDLLAVMWTATKFQDS